MTPGQEALAEAARMEAARIYGATVREHHNSPADMVNRDDEVAYYHRHGQSLASIAFRLGTTKSAVRESLSRLGAA